jgi:hypothetical protein
MQFQEMDVKDRFVHACAMGDLYRVQTLLPRITTGHTLKQGVVRACAFGHCNVVQWLLDELPGGQWLGEDALWSAAYSGRLNVLQWLVTCKRVAVASPIGRMALVAACRRGDRPTAIGLFALDPRPSAWPAVCVRSIQQWMQWSKARYAWMRACVVVRRPPRPEP